MGPIVIASGNPHKVKELRALFGGAMGRGPEFIGLSEAAGLGPARASGLHEPDETGASFEQNAAIKALDYGRQTGHLCLADDSGLEIDALGGRPGVISSHYCTDGRETGMTREERDRANNERVLRELAGTPPEGRGARFVCVMVLAGPDGQMLARTRGVFEGRIGLETQVPRGEHGFGYDPIFLVAPDFTRTSAELPPHEKNELSHRAAAAREMGERLRSI